MAALDQIAKGEGDAATIARETLDRFGPKALAPTNCEEKSWDTATWQIESAKLSAPPSCAGSWNGAASLTPPILVRKHRKPRTPRASFASVTVGLRLKAAIGVSLI
jgi:hypothetical protein